MSGKLGIFINVDPEKYKHKVKNYVATSRGFYYINSHSGSLYKTSRRICVNEEEQKILRQVTPTELSWWK